MALARDRAGIVPEEGLSALSAFRLFTSGGAAALGEPAPLAPGSPADFLVVDREDLTLRQFISTDWQGGTSTFRFTDFQENVGVSDSEIIFTIPDGAEVIRHDANPE